MIYRVAYKFTGHRHDAEDIAQEVCVGLVDKLQSFRGESSVSTWLYRIVVNACRDFHKKQKTHRTHDKTYMDMEQQQKAESGEDNQKVTWLYRAIATLEQTLKETALLVLAEEVSHAEAGKILGCAESTISWRMHEIRKQLKLVMEQSHGG